jgi:GNAT superfamily N-acetyltransferase
MADGDAEARAAAGVARIRPGGPGDTAVMLALFDAAVAWLVARGQRGQWGVEPFSSRASAVARLTEWAAGGGARLAEDADGRALGLGVLGARPPWVAPVDARERYVEALVTSREHAGRGLGGLLLRRLAAEARAAGAAVLRVDCWGDAPGLVAWYERQGFRRSGTFVLEDGWHGQILTLRLDAPPGPL